MKKLSLLSIILIFTCTLSLKANENIDKVYQVISEEECLKRILFFSKRSRL